MFSGCFSVLPLLRRRCILLHYQVLSTGPPYACSNKHDYSSKEEALLADEAAARSEAYRQLQNLDFKSAAKILFTTPPKRKKFGLDFHLVQLFFTCLPSLAVYLVAQYARYDIRRMEAEVEQKKKKAEEENRIRDAEMNPTKEEPSKELSEVKIRLEALEEALKEIVDEKRKVIHSEPNSDKICRPGNVQPSEKALETKNEAKGFGGLNTAVTQNGKIQHKDVDIAGA